MRRGSFDVLCAPKAPNLCTPVKGAKVATDKDSG